MRMQLTDKGRDLARRIFQAEAAVTKAKAELAKAQAARAAVLEELAAALPPDEEPKP